MKFTVRDCDPNTGVPDDDGYDDEYVVSSVHWFCVNLIGLSNEQTWFHLCPRGCYFLKNV